MSTAAELLALQSNIKKDPDGYKDEFLLQYRHYQALLEIFKLKPSKDSREFGEVVMFMAQVSRAYPKTMTGFAAEVAGLLDTHHQELDSTLRRTLVGALILMRNRAQVDAMTVLPLFFRLFRCQDKALRQQLFRHIVSDLKAANKKCRNERLNRAVQNFMYTVVSDDNEAAAKRGLAVLTEMWRRHVWRDARTVNVIASAAFHKSPRVLLAVMKFFLGQDRDDEDGSDKEGEGEGDEEDAKPKGPSKEDIYSAYHKGTSSSKKKKQKKLKRVIATVKKADRRKSAAGGGAESFAAIHLLHDPQAFAERLFGRLSGGGERFETRLAVMAVVSRIIGVHKLLVLNFYPYLQKYIAPHQRDVTQVLAALVQAAHDLVPPETLAPVLRQLVDQFVHDKARPEVMTVGLKTVRELVLRCPLVMEADLLTDLAQYKKFREKQVATAARSLIGAFRDINPEMLAKKDRGRGADMALKPRDYGDARVATRVDGAELLEAALAEGRTGSDGDEVDLGLDDSSSDDDDDGDGGSGGWEDVSEEEGDGGAKEGAGEGEGEEGGEDSDLESLSGEGEGEEDGSSDWEDVSEEGEEEEEAAAAAGKGKAKGKAAAKAKAKPAATAGRKGKKGAPANEDDEEEEDVEEEESGSDADLEDLDSEESEEASEEDEEDDGGRRGKRGGKPQPAKPKVEAKPDSIASLKRKLAEAKEKAAAKRAREEPAGDGEGGEEGQAPAGVPIEAERILTQEDFDRIKRLKQKALVEAALAKAGVTSAASKAKKQRALESAEEEAAELLALQERLTTIGESKVNAADLTGKHKARKDKEARLASVLEGREGREKFGARSSLKKKKTAGLSEREKQRRKAMPMAARVQQIRRRNAAARGKKMGKNFKGHVRG
ncbi:hypothetical protein CHLRE_06g277050v5 [Chlamydomonas reinhardtii]|uniref:Protein SDA1 n=1 Tax=Chlamydomonas reinhardtii TaxID=3055 RepID=A0A2K3DNR0_CHLRE|nr:uncharacterized protein CHLRE_06g277050v5 [Chlamydomonas reinhardtii]PNW82173.1 hypothetical protein CHLRE_06g277050v5 [Chlamydomonas reinhardtii]